MPEFKKGISVNGVPVINDDGSFAVDLATQAELEAHIHPLEWLEWTPTVTQGGGAITLGAGTFAMYHVVGAATLFQVKLVLGGAGTGGNAITITGQPASLLQLNTYMQIGQARWWNEGAWYRSYDIIATAQATWQLMQYDTAAFAGVSPADALASGDTIMLWGMTRPYPAGTPAWI